jgi:hypothetical protein
MILRSGPVPDLMLSCIDAVTRLAADCTGSVAGFGDSNRGLRTVAPVSTNRSGVQVAPITRIPPLYALIAAWPHHKLLMESI